MQSVSSKIWTRVAVSISFDDSHYTTGSSKATMLRLDITLSCILLVVYSFRKYLLIGPSRKFSRKIIFYL